VEHAPEVVAEFASRFKGCDREGLSELLRLEVVYELHPKACQNTVDDEARRRVREPASPSRWPTIAWCLHARDVRPLRYVLRSD
jgi:hypothetical protein